MGNEKKVVASIVVSVVLLLLVFVLFPATLYVVDERELAVVLQFGDPVAERTEPGLSVKVPFIQEVRKLPKTRQFWGGEAQHELPDLPTADGKKVEVVPWAIWRITEPTTFVRVLVTMDRAEAIVAQVVRSAMRNGITKHDLAELVRSTDRELTYSFRVDSRESDGAGETPDNKVPLDPVAEQTPESTTPVRVGRQKILEEIKRNAMRDLAREDGSAQAGGRGIELIDVGIAKIDFVPEVRDAAFNRLIAFMESIASFYTYEGQRERQEILNRTHADVQRIEGEGKRESNEIRGNVEADMIRDYAKAIAQSEEFYTFVRTLEAYKKVLAEQTRLIMTTNSEFFRLLKEFDAAPTTLARPVSE
jgi:membrane protease subunit HflC